MPSLSPGQIILLNGASSAGKSTLCRAIQAQADVPLLQFSLDFFMFGHGVLPGRREESGAFAWASIRPKLFGGYFGCLAALAQAGNSLVVDYIVETPEQLTRLTEVLKPYNVFFVGVHCPLPELERREQLRGDRRVGDAQRDFQTVHTFSAYDFEIDSSLPAEANARAVLEAWRKRQGPGVFTKKAAND
ncbi:chloramphenicol phosphotransferase CPT family protein [Deinococcus altitudinis]|uniref:chloramphenicol phosphotransferase CPT family protein n=1 Tax=Deinococcus altitudinis TaxID=468914 RepID=UPI003891E1C7